MTKLVHQDAKMREHDFLVALCRTGDPVRAAAEAGFDDPAYAARLLMGSPRIRQALAAAERAQLNGIALAAGRITQRWLERLERWMENEEDPTKVPMKEVLRAHKVASDARAKLEQAEQQRAIANASLAAIEAIAERMGIDLDTLTGRNLIDAKEKL